MGLTLALELARRGHSPLVLERSSDLVSGCSAGSAGLLSAAHSTPLATPSALQEGVRYMFRSDTPFAMTPRAELVPWIARFIVACRPAQVRRGIELTQQLSTASLEMHAALFEEGLDTGFHRSGVLDVYETEHGFELGKREAVDHRRAGLDSSILESLDARDLQPALSSAIAGAIHYPGDGHCDPALYLRAIADAAREAGAKIETGVDVKDLRLDRRRVTLIETSRDRIQPGTVIIAAGAWTPRLAHSLPVRVPIQGGKGYHVDLERRGSDPGLPIYMQEARVIATPMQNALRLAGTLQLSGLDMSVAASRVRAVFEAGTRTLTGINQERVRTTWRGIRPCTPDGLPMIGPSRAVDNVVFATGHAMKGLHLAPVTARIVADLLEGRRPTYDTTALLPDRFRWSRANHHARTPTPHDDATRISRRLGGRAESVGGREQ